MTIEADRAGEIADAGAEHERQLRERLEEQMASESDAARAAALDAHRLLPKSEAGQPPPTFDAAIAQATVNRLEHDLRDANNTIKTLEQRTRELQAQVNFAERLLRR